MPAPDRHQRVLPALLDRLTDDSRFLTELVVRTSAALLAERGLTIEDVGRSLERAGYRKLEDEADPTRTTAQGSEWTLRFVSRPGMTGLATPRSLSIHGAGGGRPVELQACCDVTARRVPGHDSDADAGGVISMRELRRIVQRDVDWLLNASGVEPDLDLSRYPEVRRSVLNFGMPMLSGLLGSALDPLQVAARIKDTLQRFEPRLSHVRVTPLAGEPGSPPEFRIDAELWGAPVSQAWSARTRIDLANGSVVVEDAVGG